MPHDSNAARAAGEAYLESTKPLGSEPMGTFITEARRVVTALLEALRETVATTTRPLSAVKAGLGEPSSRLAAAPLAPSTPSTPGPWQVEREDSKTTSGEPVVTWWVWRAPSHYLTQLDTEAGALTVRDALNGEASPALTVERLAELLRQMGVDSRIITSNELAAWLLPRLAGPAPMDSSHTDNLVRPPVAGPAQEGP